MKLCSRPINRTDSARRGRYCDKGIYRENALAIESEAILSKRIAKRTGGGARKERNLNCDLRVAAVNKRTLPPYV